MARRGQISAGAALRTNDMWSKTIGHDPYAEKDSSTAPRTGLAEQAANIMLLAKMSNTGNESRGGCKRCGGVGHLTFQCRNPVASATDAPSSSSSSDSDSDNDMNFSTNVHTHIQRNITNDIVRDNKTEKEHAYKSSQKDVSKLKLPTVSEKTSKKDKERKKHKTDKKDKKEKKNKKDKKEKKEKKG